MGKEAILVIDVQKCFLPGGTLATYNERNQRMEASTLAKGINEFIKSKSDADVFITQDWHTPGHTSFARENQGEVPIVNMTGKEGKRINLNRYRGRNLKSERFWGNPEERYAQKLWTEHCVQDTDDAKVDEAVTAGLEDRNVQYVYKGDDKEIDSYSAIADALGDFTPHLKTGEKFKDVLMSGEYDTIYLTGIARDVCVFWTLMDILNYITLPSGSKKPKVVYVYDLTRPVASGVIVDGVSILDKTKEQIEKEVDDIMTKMKVDLSMKSQVFEIMDSGKYAGGGRRRGVKTRKAHTKGCNCKSCWSKMKGGKRRGTRKPMGHKKGCKCVVCRR
jgi:nicotinamidase-related amidase